MAVSREWQPPVTAISYVPAAFLLYTPATHYTSTACIEACDSASKACYEDGRRLHGMVQTIMQKCAKRAAGVYNNKPTYTLLLRA